MPIRSGRVTRVPAGILFGLLLDWPAARTIHLANHLGAYVATRHGATPELPREITDLLK